MYHLLADAGQISDEGKHISITGADYNHIVNVLRMKKGDEISVSISNGDDREYRYGIEEITDSEVTGSLRFIKEEGLELPSRIYLFQGLPKSDKMEFIVQKAVELGAYAVIPVRCSRCVVKLDDKKAAAKAGRWQTIAKSAAEQSRRAIVPEVMLPMTMKEAVGFAADMDVRLIPYELASGMNHTREIIESVRPGQKIAFFIGPEGGFDEKEIKLAMDAGIEPVTMGRRILRTETAGLTMLSWLMYQLD